MNNLKLICLILSSVWFLSTPVVANDWVDLKYDASKAPADNPLKGFMPYIGNGVEDKFPYSMEWFYIGLDEVMDGPASFTFDSKLEGQLEAAASRGKQCVFRVFLDYPDFRHAVPKFLLDGGHKLLKYESDTPDNPGGFSPDYKDEKLVKAMEACILAFGKSYDGDPRIAFITVGYLGHWGEWHTFGNEHLMADRKVQKRILKAYKSAFTKTKFVLRYPDSRDPSISCGFHDDSFAYETLYDKNKDWHFLSRAKEAKAMDVWKSEPIGGEVYPDFQETVWNLVLPKEHEDFFECVENTHCSWLINDYLFSNELKAQQRKRALKGANAVGYQLYVEGYKISNGELKVRMTNRGVAPFYYPWPVEVVDVDTNRIVPTNWDITKVLPGERIEYSVKVNGKNFGMRIPNPMKSGNPLRFANETQGKDLMLLK